MSSQETPRQRIIVAALSVIADRGIYGATIEEIATAAGYSPGAIYKHFKNRDAVIQAAREEIEREILSLTEEDLPFKVSVDDYMRWMLTRFLTRVEQRRNLFRNLMLYQTMRDDRYSVHRIMHARMTEVMRRAIDAGELAERPPETIATALSGLSNALVFEWLMSNSERTIQDLVEEIVGLFMYGAAAQRPRADDT